MQVSIQRIIVVVISAFFAVVKEYSDQHFGLCGVWFDTGKPV